MKFIQKIKEAVNLYKEQMDTMKKIKQGTMLFCPLCKSPCVGHGESKLAKHPVGNKEDNHFLIEETYPVKCGHCNGHGIITEYWAEGELLLKQKDTTFSVDKVK